MRLGAAASIYKDELHGDVTQTIALCSLYDKQVVMQQSEKSTVKYKKEPISDKRLFEHLNLPANDTHFTSFNAYVNDACQKAITDLYGKFSNKLHYSSGMKSCLNSDPLSKTICFGRGYLDSHVLLKSWLILAKVLSMYS